MSDWDEVRIACLERQVKELQRVVRWHEDYLDTYLMTPAWKRWLFIIDGWSGHKVVERPKWRPWRRWWTS